MSTEDGGGPVPADDPAAWTRAVRLGRATTGRIRNVARALYLAGGIAMGVGVAAHVAGADLLLADLVGVATAAVLVALASLPFRDPDLRAATELVTNHQVRESGEWRRETGTRMPRGRPAIRRWLDVHPSSSGRGSLLMVIGRFAEAEAYWEQHPGRTPEEAFGVEVQRETAFLLAAGAPDLERLHDLWRRLPETAERRNRRECLAILEAEAGLQAGHDPIAVLAHARPETGAVARSARPATMITVNFLLPVAVLAVLTGIRLIVRA